MSNSLRIERQSSDGVTRIVLAGEITEEAAFDQVGPIDGPTVLDLAGIKRINSCGVREWIGFVRGVSPGSKLQYERCSAPMVVQANMIANFLGPGRVTSFVAPYFCEKCERASEVLLSVDKDFPGGEIRAPHRKCEKCGGELLFDDLEDSYFAFLK